MRRPTILVFVATLVASLAWLAPANAQTGAPSASARRAQAERNAVDLKQGMTIEDVQRLLGKPQRTALRNDGGAPSSAGQGTLQWTYVWSSPGTSSLSERTLVVDFAAKAAEQWLVNGWGWNGY